jgi:hypothetical protein
VLVVNVFAVPASLTVSESAAVDSLNACIDLERERTSSESGMKDEGALMQILIVLSIHIHADTFAIAG